MEREERKGRIRKGRKKGEHIEKVGVKRGNMWGVREVSKLSLVLYYAGGKSDE